ncbi:hypothetical protein V6N13_149577 [Hibiscus sabdariffa]
MRSQRQAAYGLIPDSVFFCLLFISQLPLLEPTLPAGARLQDRRQSSNHFFINAILASPGMKDIIGSSSFIFPRLPRFNANLVFPEVLQEQNAEEQDDANPEQVPEQLDQVQKAKTKLLPKSVSYPFLLSSALSSGIGKSRERGQTRVPLLDVNIITGFALGQLLVPRELDSMVGLQGHCPMLVGLYWFSLFCFMPKTIGPTMSLERERCCCYNILFSSCVVLLDL